MPPRKRQPTTEQDVLALDGQIDTQPFFESKRAAAVLKHAILSGYVSPFAVKTGSTSVDHRVAIVDGYAGAGRYDDEVVVRQHRGRYERHGIEDGGR